MKPSNLFFSFFLSLTFVLSACSSAKSRGEDALAAGNAEEALREYDAAVSENSSDEEALTGRQRARIELLRAKLIQVRMLRFAKNEEEQLKLVLWILSKEAEWNIAPDVKAALAQQEEVDDALDLVRVRIREDLQKAFPLRALLTMKKHQLLIPPKDASLMEKAMAQKGREVCAILTKQKEGRTPYYNHFAERFCAYWKRPFSSGPEVKAQEENSRMASILFRGARFEIAGDLNSATRSILEQAMQDAFKRTPWYSAAGPSLLTGTIRAAYSANHTKVGIFQVQNYYADETYVDHEQVTKFRQVPYEETERVYDPSTNNYTERKFTNYRTETYMETQPVERTRSVERSYRYPAWQHEQTLAVSLDGSALIKNEKIDFALRDTSVAKGIEHNEDRPEMGLRPSQPNLPDPEGWLKQKVEAFAANFAERAQKRWIELFCAAPEGKASGNAWIGNQAVLCLRGKPSSMPAFAENWFQNTLGVSAQDAYSYLGI